MELKSLSKPSPGVEKIMAVLLILLRDEKNAANHNWENAKKMMAKVSA